MATNYDLFRNHVATEIARLENMLLPLKNGTMRLLESENGDSPVDVTEARIEEFEQSITTWRNLLQD